jgi:hypothetical protein
MFVNYSWLFLGDVTLPQAPTSSNQDIIHHSFLGLINEKNHDLSQETVKETNI